MEEYRVWSKLSGYQRNFLFLVIWIINYLGIYHQIKTLSVTYYLKKKNKKLHIVL